MDLNWVNGEFQEWSLHPYDNMTIDIGIMFALQLGVGVKGFLDAYVKGTAGLDVIFTISAYTGNSILITAAVAVTVGMTAFFVTVSRSWNIWDQRLYPPEIAGNLLWHYMHPNGDDPEPEKKEPGYLEPQSYPALAAEAEEKAWTWSTQSDGYPTKIIEINGNMFAFSIFKATGVDGKQHSRVGYRLINPQSGEFTPMKSLQDIVDGLVDSNPMTYALINDRNDYAFDVYAVHGAVDDYVFVVATSAQEFDEDGHPIRNDMSGAGWTEYLNQIAYMMELTCDADGNIKNNRTPQAESYQWESDPDEDHQKKEYDSLGTPRITNARLTWSDPDKKSLEDVELYGVISRVAYTDDPNPAGSTAFAYRYSGPVGFMLYPDRTVKSGMGKDYEFAKIEPLLDVDATDRISLYFDPVTSTSFVGMSRPKDGAAGDNAIELFGFDMNNVERKAIVLDQGPIGSFLGVKDTDAPEGEPAGTTVFYTLGETNGDGATQYRLCSIHIGSVTGEGTSDVEYDVTRYEYDVVLPTCDFDICYLGAVPYLYWVGTTVKKQDSDPDVWRVWATPYDSMTNTLASPSVLAEFTLPKIEYIAAHSDDSVIYYDDTPTINNVMLTGTGTSYVNAAFSDVESIPEEDRPKRTPVSVCSVPEMLKPSANMITAVPEELLVKAGSFDDFMLGVMNDGNMAITSLDLAMYEVTDSGDENLVETAHIDALDPTKNAVTMADGTVVQSGESAGYRNEDYDKPPPQARLGAGSRSAGLQDSCGGRRGDGG